MSSDVKQVLIGSLSQIVSLINKKREKKDLEKNNSL